jgi:metal-responsive CopG/Arc/MetJ family transcriptional regulator
MASVKIAISMPAALLTEADRMARARKESRSAFLAGLVARAAKAARDRRITAQLDEVFGDADVAREQRAMAGEVLKGEAFGDDEPW